MFQLVVRVLATFAVLATSLLLPVRPVSADSVTTLQRQVADLRVEANRATKALTKNTSRYEEARRRLRQTERRLLATAQHEQRVSDDREQARQGLVDFAVAAYQGPGGDELSGLLENPLATVARSRSTSDAAYLADSRAHAVRSYGQELARQRALHRQAKTLERSVTGQQKRLAAQQKRLQAESKRITDKLLDRLDRLTVRLVKAKRYGDAFQVSRERLKRSGASGASCEKPTVRGFPNGLIPMALLCPLPQPGHSLRADAARGFWLLDTAYKMRFDRHICITDSYRSLAAQHAVYRAKPGLAAVPGTSRHGLGMAVDLGCGIQIFGSTPYRWMKRNAPKFGWVHPRWAETTRLEPWHWEYQG
ncbi:MAG: hypothetical protein GEV07_05605 [Streptosporangiales bacterium]|nr:hypothetical protein [Streptosporangiales bacterium]